MSAPSRARRSLQSKTIVLVFLVVALVTLPRLTYGQLPGHWELSLRAPHGWVPREMAFCDSACGVLLVDSEPPQPPFVPSSGAYRTTDGGKTWEFNNWVDTDILMLRYTTFESNNDYPHLFTMPDRQHLYFMDQARRDYISSDGGTSWSVQSYPELPYDEDPVGFRMFPNGSGYLLMKHSKNLGTLSIYKTNDFAQSFQKLPFPGEEFTDLLDDVVISDSDHFWGCSLGVSWTTDEGKDWSSMEYLDTAKNGISSIPRSIADADTSRAYIVLNEGVDSPWMPDPDFAETTDGGKTWRLDSSLGNPRIYFMNSPAPNVLWAAVGPANNSSRAFDFTDVYDREAFADSVFYSSDDGHSWTKDSTTFIGDTLVLMSWPDARHGYLTAWRDSTLLLYRFVPNSARVQRSPSAAFEISIFPDPLSTTATLSLTGIPSGNVEIYDMLGRDVARFRMSGSYEWNASALPVGTYMVHVEDGDVRDVRRVTIER